MANEWDTLFANSGIDFDELSRIQRNNPSTMESIANAFLPEEYEIGQEQGVRPTGGEATIAPSGASAPQEGQGFIDQAQLGLETAFAETEGGARLLAAEISDYFGAEDMSRYQKAMAERKLKTVKENEGNLGTVGQGFRMAGNIAPDVALMLGTGGLGTAARLATIGAGSMGLSTNDILAGQYLEGQEVDLAKAAPHAAATAATDMLIGRVSPFLPTSSPVVRAGLESAASGAQGQMQYNLALDKPLTEDVLMASAIGGTLGAGGRGVIDAYQGLNERFNAPLNERGERAAKKLGELGDTVKLDDAQRRAYIERENLARAYEEEIINEQDPVRRNEIVKNKVDFEADDVYAPMIDMLDMFKKYGIQMHRGLADTPMSNFDNKVFGKLGDVVPSINDYDAGKAKTIVSEATPHFLNRDSAQKNLNTSAKYDEHIQTRGNEMMKAETQRIKSIPGYIQEEIDLAEMQGYSKDDLEPMYRMLDSAEKIANYTDGYVSVSGSSDISKMKRHLRILEEEGARTGLNKIIADKSGIQSIPTFLNTLQAADRGLENLTKSWRHGAASPGSEKTLQPGIPYPSPYGAANLARETTLNLYRGTVSTRRLAKEKERGAAFADEAIGELQRRSDERQASSELGSILKDRSRPAGDVLENASNAAAENLEDTFGVNTGRTGLTTFTDEELKAEYKQAMEFGDEISAEAIKNELVKRSRERLGTTPSEDISKVMAPVARPTVRATEAPVAPVVDITPDVEVEPKVNASEKLARQPANVEPKAEPTVVDDTTTQEELLQVEADQALADSILEQEYAAEQRGRAMAMRAMANDPRVEQVQDIDALEAENAAALAQQEAELLEVRAKMLAERQEANSIMARQPQQPEPEPEIDAEPDDIIVDTEIETPTQDTVISDYKSTPTENDKVMKSPDLLPISMKERIDEAEEIKKGIPELIATDRVKATAEVRRIERVNDTIHEKADDKKVTIEVANEAYERMPKELQQGDTSELKKYLGQYIDEVVAEKKAEADSIIAQEKSTGSDAMKKLKERFNTALQRSRDNFNIKLERAKEKANKDAIKDKWSAFDTFTREQGMSKPVVDEYLLKNGIKRGDDINLRTLRGGIYKDVTDAKNQGKTSPKTTFTVKEAKDLVLSEFPKLSPELKDKLDTVFNRLEKTELRGITPSRINSILKDFDRDVQKEIEAFDSELDQLVSAEQSALDEEKAFYDKWRNASQDDTVDQATVKAMFGQVAQARKNLSYIQGKSEPASKARQERLDYLEARKKQEEELLQLEKQQEAEAKKFEDEQAKAIDTQNKMNELSKQIDSIEFVMRENGANDAIIESFMEESGLNNTYKPVNEGAYVSRGIKFTKQQLNFANEDIDDTINDAIKDAESQISKLSGTQLEGAVDEILSTISDAGNEVNNLKELSAMLDVVIKKKNSIAKDSESGQIAMKSAEAVKAAVDFASKQKQEFPDNPELWLSRGLYRDITKAFDKEGSPAGVWSGGLQADVRSLIFSDEGVPTKYRTRGDYLSQFEIEQRSKQLKNKDVKSILGSDFKLSGGNKNG